MSGTFRNSLCLHGTSIVLDVVDVNAVDSVVEIPDVQSQVVIVHQLHVVHLLVDELVPRLVRLHPHRHLGADLRPRL